jgi:pimeloyl-ACP methyl ester carboxylesterase
LIARTSLRSWPSQNGALIEHSIDLLADRISIVHAKDRAARGAFVAAGSGVIDFPHFIGRLRASGWLAAIAADGPGVSERDVQRIRVPTLVIGNGFDRIHPLALARELAAAIPNSRFVEIAPKSAYRLRYVAEFRAAVADFLKQETQPA